jgi:hypothetical protein
LLPKGVGGSPPGINIKILALSPDAVKKMEKKNAKKNVAGKKEYV